MEKIEKKYFTEILLDAYNENRYVTFSPNECNELLRHLGFFGEKNEKN